MNSICMIAEKIPQEFEGRVKEKSMHHARGAFDALAYFQKNPETVFLIFMKEESQTLELLRLLLKASPQMKAAVLSDCVSPDLELRAMEAGAQDVFSDKLPFSALCQRLERIGGYDKLASSENSRGSILIVDDDEGVRKFLSLVFKKSGYETMLAESGEKAVEMVRVSAPSVVLLDMMMPGMDGLETMKRLLEIKPGLGIVMATGLCDESLAQQSMQLGAYAYVMKPFDLPYLELVVLTRLCLAA